MGALVIVGFAARAADVTSNISKSRRSAKENESQPLREINHFLLTRVASVAARSITPAQRRKVY